MLRVPTEALAFGFRNDPVGALTSRTIMLAELRLLLASGTPSTTPAEIDDAIVLDNMLLKRSVSGRHRARRHLREWYALDPDVTLYRLLRCLWDADPAAQPLLALLCAAAREPALRASADLIAHTAAGTRLTPEQIAGATAANLPGRYNTGIIAKIGRNAASSWQQSGHLSGKLVKVRSRASCRPVAVAYALALGHLCGMRGEGLFATPWARLLDRDHATLREQAVAAGQHGWLQYRHAGGITEIGFRGLLSPDELAVCG